MAVGGECIFCTVQHMADPPLQADQDRNEPGIEAAQEEDQRVFRVESSDGTEFRIPHKSLSLCHTLAQMVQGKAHNTPTGYYKQSSAYTLSNTSGGCVCERAGLMMSRKHSHRFCKRW